MIDIARNKSYPNDLIGVDTNIGSFFVWTSWLGIKYMKHFSSPEEAMTYVENNYQRYVQLTLPIAPEVKKEWCEKLRQQLDKSKCTYSFFRTFLIFTVTLLVVVIANWVFSWLGGLVPQDSGLALKVLFYGINAISLFLFFIQLFVAIAFAIFTPLKIIEWLIFRKIIKKHSLENV